MKAGRETLPASPRGVLHLIVMSRAPVAGETKTRLIPALGAEGARDFHVACINDLLAEGRAWAARRGGEGGSALPFSTRAPSTVAPAKVALTTVRLHLFIHPPDSRAVFRRAGVKWPEDYGLHNQRGENLGERMAHAMAHVLKRESTAGSGGARSGIGMGAGGRVPGALLIGTDLPLLTLDHLDEAAAALDSVDVVFGPTADGGYYLVGMKEASAAMFDLPAWESGQVLAQSLAAAKALGKSTACIATLPDADRPEDLRALLDHPLAKSLARRESLRYIAAHRRRLAPVHPGGGPGAP